MSHEIFTPDWAAAWGDELRESARFRRATAKWEGSILLRMEGDAASGITGERAVYLDLVPGDCRDARPATNADRQGATYAIAASASSWLGLVSGELDPLLALMSGRLRLERGALLRLARHVDVARELIAAARRVDFHLPDEPPGPAAGEAGSGSGPGEETR